MTATMTRTDIIHWIRNLPVDAESSIQIGDKYVTGTVAEIWDETYDSCEYEYKFTIDGEDADEHDVIHLVDED